MSSVSAFEDLTKHARKQRGRCCINAFIDDPNHAEDLHAWQILRPLLDAGNYLPWSTGSMRPAGLVLICNEIVHAGKLTVVECGSGVSTVVLARLLRQLGGTLVSLEHDANWGALVTDLLRRESLGDIAQVIQAPLTGDPLWYDRSAIAQTPGDIDLLVVDGPPAYSAGHGARRLPALTAFDTRLSATATVILDDANRLGEQQVLQNWMSDGSWRFSVDEAAGVAVGRRIEST